MSYPLSNSIGQIATPARTTTPAVVTSAAYQWGRDPATMPNSSNINTTPVPGLSPPATYSPAGSPGEEIYQIAPAPMPAQAAPPQPPQCPLGPVPIAEWAKQCTGIHRWLWLQSHEQQSQ